MRATRRWPVRLVGVEALEDQRTLTSSDLKDLDDDRPYFVLLG